MIDMQDMGLLEYYQIINRQELRFRLFNSIRMKRTTMQLRH